MDKFCIGEAAYHELTCCPGGEELPRSYLVKQCKEDLNKLCSIERTPGEASGVAFNLHDELSTVIEKMVSFFFWAIYHKNIVRKPGPCPIVLIICINWNQLLTLGLVLGKIYLIRVLKRPNTQVE